MPLPAMTFTAMHGHAAFRIRPLYNLSLLLRSAVVFQYILHIAGCERKVC